MKTRLFLHKQAGLAKAFAQLKAGRRFATASITALAIFGAGTGFSFLAQVAAARFLGAQAYGEYAIVVAWIMLAASLCTLGFHVSLVRLIPAYLCCERWSETNGAIRFAIGATAFVSVVVAALGSLAIHMFVSATHPDLARAFQVGLVAMPFLTLHLVFAAIVRAFGGIVLALAPERVLRDGVVLGSLIVAAWAGLTMNATTAAAALLVSSIVILLVVVYGAKRLHPVALTGQAPSYAIREWRALALPLVCLTLADNLLTRSGVMVLGMDGRTRDAGIFAIAFNLAQLAALPRMAVAIAFAPTVSDLHARRDQSALQALSARAAWLAFSGTACVAIPIVVLSPTLLNWFGPGFAEGASAASLLALAQLICAGFGPQQHLITMTGHERVAATLMSVSAFATIAICMIMRSTLGVFGVAVVMAASLVVWNIAMAQFIHARLQLLPGLAAPFMTRITPAVNRSEA